MKEELAEDAAENTVEEEIPADEGQEEAGKEDAGSGETQAGEENSQPEEEAVQPETAKETEKKGFFKKKDKKDKKDLQIEDLTDKLKRSMAEFENFRKRTEKEKAAMYEVGAKSVIEKILPVVDNFERGMATLSEEEAHSPFAEGMDKIYKQLLTTLEGMDVKAIEAVGQEFNPDFHNAVMHVEDESVGENIVVEEFQKGYLYRESVVRHSMVKVAN
ncbi:nucleotide exchange factor GrpE [Fusibacillus kribbianus]|uniref:Protein GrpE n=1 Tax=Fusibacillus kribbianus TaxID=3044208 RepID=A0AAP4EZX8_9FIRM|nr:nucleotide exchange factor GrpE [Ruminococcus sp. YH-rum2234]MDI9240958.1 nucleotide exchange factor GrpE [Ruminococcus sp. YH-rum2234]